MTGLADPPATTGSSSTGRATPIGTGITGTGAAAAVVTTTTGLPYPHARGKEQGKSSSSSKEHGKSSRNKHIKFNGEEQVDNTSDDDWLARPTRRRSSSSDRGSTEADDDDGDKEDKNCRGLASSYGWAEDAFSAPGALRMWQDPSKSSSSSEDNDTEREDNSDKGSSADGDEDEEDNETYDALSFPGIDDDINDGGSDNADAADDDESKSQSVELKIRLWLAKNHLRIKIFICRKWISTTVYRLTWTNHQELEELFESSFKMDIGAPVATNTVFRIRDCVMDFGVLMIDTPSFGELVSELQPSIRDFKFCQKLGGEAECRVFKVLSKGCKFAVKTICLDEYCSMEPREVDIISSLKDKRVMAFYQAWIEPWSYKGRPVADYIFILLELCESTLKEKLKPENFKDIVDRWFLFEEMVKSVKAIHGEFIIHRDLKPDNVFFGADRGIRIGDFGDACIGRDAFGKSGGTPNLGTENYAAPELESAEKITEKADTYPLGVMFIELFTTFTTAFGRLRLLGDLRKEGLRDDWVGDLVGDREGTHGLVERMVASEPAYRLSAAEILEFIQR